MLDQNRQFCLFVGVESMSVLREMSVDRRELFIALLETEPAVLNGVITSRFENLLEQAAELEIKPDANSESEREQLVESLSVFLPRYLQRELAVLQT